jgi:glyoxylase-like metal-dependent hydrolase (beta-lactamase superfamily II)
MDQLWGMCEPVPEERITTVGESERLSFGGRRVEVAYTPGHASHHVSYLDVSTGTAFVGDAAGGRINDAGVVVPATPPPETDLEAIRASLRRLAAWNPERLVVTHFGGVADPLAHFDILDDALLAWAEQVRRSLAVPGSDDERCAAFVQWAEDRLRQSVGSPVAAAYASGIPLWMSWQGLARYWRKREVEG